MPLKINLKVQGSTNVLRLKQKGTSLLGQYRTLLPAKLPRNFKSMKKPEELFKDKFSRKIIKEIYSEYKSISNLFTKLESVSNTPDPLCISVEKNGKRLITFLHQNKLYNNGIDLHVYLPLGGMNHYGYFYKAIIEQIMPNARVTFLVTPFSASIRSKYNSIELKNLKINLSKSINVHDKNFLIIDYFWEGKLFDAISKILPKLTNKPASIELFKSPVSVKGTSGVVKDDFGKNAIPIYQAKNKLNVDKAEINNLRKKEIINKYVWTYLGYKLINSLKG